MPTSSLQEAALTPAAQAQGTVSNMLEESVVQPLLVTTSALNLATECVRMILKVDLLISVSLCKQRCIGVVGSDAERSVSLLLLCEVPAHDLGNL